MASARITEAEELGAGRSNEPALEGRNVIERLFELASTRADNIMEVDRDSSRQWRLGDAAHRTAAWTWALLAVAVIRAARARWFVARRRWIVRRARNLFIRRFFGDLAAMLAFRRSWRCFFGGDVHLGRAFSGTIGANGTLQRKTSVGVRQEVGTQANAGNQA
jgi:hypothetical protein